jgi:hypothetical protein
MIDHNTMNFLVAIIIAAGIGIPFGGWFARKMLKRGWWK